MYCTVYTSPHAYEYVQFVNYIIFLSKSGNFEIDSEMNAKFIPSNFFFMENAIRMMLYIKYIQFIL
jgi:hypothetical protein